MSESKASILFVSSANPIKGPGTIALDIVEALRQNGYDVDFLTKYKVAEKSDIKYIFKKNKANWLSKIASWNNLKFKIWSKIVKLNMTNHYLFYRLENEPPVSIKKIKKVIKKEYDAVIIFFWQGLLSYRTVESIFDMMKKKPKIIFLCADYSPMTGGCHFIGDCEYYKNGCGNCPMVNRGRKKKDFSAKNVEERIRINSKIQPFILVNSYMESFFRKAPAMQRGARTELSYGIVDLVKFKEQDRIKCRESIGIANDAKFVILFGCQNLSDERKGMSYLLDALDYLYETVNKEDRKNICILTIGKLNQELQKRIKFKQKHLGYVEFSELPTVYSAADVFVSPSINDAGPSMVNQSIACGTPVVSFEVGIALDIVKDKGSGYCVPTKDSRAMAKAIFDIFNQDKNKKEEMRQKCRETAVDKFSYEANVKVIENCIQ